eukprot:6461528-Amphidinium_carterae.5
MRYRATSYGERIYTPPALVTSPGQGNTLPTVAAPSSGGDCTTTFKFVTFNALSTSDDAALGRDGLNSTGQLAHLTSMLTRDNVDLCTIQETRLNIIEISLADYDTHAVPAIKGRGGLLTLVKKSPHTKITHTSSPHPRLQLTRVTHHSTILHILNAHAPVRDDLPAVHRTFQRHLITATSNIPHAHHFIGGIDFNARLGPASDTYSIAGPFTTDTLLPDHVADVLNHFQSQLIFFTNTIFPPFSNNGEPIL